MKKLTAIAVWFSALALLLRVLHVHFDFPLPFNSPIKIEGTLALAIMVRLIWTAKEENPSAHQGELSRSDVLWLLGLVVLTAVNFTSSLNSDFLSDDYILINHAISSSPKDFQHFWQAGGDGFFRPFGYWSLALNSIWANTDPLKWHVSSLVLHALSSCVLFCLGKTLGMYGSSAFVASLLFSIHGSRPESVVWLASRFDLLATLFGLAAILFFALHVRDRSKLRWQTASLICLSMALLSKESAFAIPLVLTLFVLLRSSDFRLVFLTVPHWLLASLIFVIRWFMLEGIGGYADPTGGRPQVLTVKPMMMLASLAHRVWAVLFFPINWDIAPGWGFSVLIGVYILCLCLLLKSDPARKLLLFGAGFVLMTALPALPQLMIGESLQKSRVIYLPSAGWALILGSALQSITVSRLRWITAAGLIAFQCAALHHNLRAWRGASVLAHRVCSQVVEQLHQRRGKIIVVGLPASLRGVYFFGHGLGECVKLQTNTDREIIQVTNSRNIAIPSDEDVVFAWDDRLKKLVLLN